MRTALALLAILATAAPAHAGVACATQPPEWAQQEPSVNYRVIHQPQAMMARACHKDAARLVAPLLGCAYLNDATNTGTALIILSAELDDADQKCVLTYEKGHIPPNNWADKTMEAGAPDDPALVAGHPTHWKLTWTDGGPGVGSSPVTYQLFPDAP
jgi:hypothetical protein